MVIALGSVYTRALERRAYPMLGLVRLAAVEQAGTTEPVVLVRRMTQDSSVRKDNGTDSRAVGQTVGQKSCTIKVVERVRDHAHRQSFWGKAGKDKGDRRCKKAR